MIFRMDRLFRSVQSKDDAWQGGGLDQGGRQPSQMEAASDDDLLRAIGQGDRRSFQRLMERHVRAMLALSTRVLRNPADADEVVQEAFLKVWTLASGWQSDREAKFSTWLYRVVLNASLDRLRRVRFVAVEEAGDPADPSPGGLDRVVARQRERLVSTAMAEMPARQRQALSLYYFSDLTAPEAARVLDLSLSAMEALLVRGKRSLKTALARLGIRGIGDVT
ncbi:DNA-directed RNA polymerase specialized sigma subunit sigma24-like protein [Paramagnetospirillum magnetotacticum MS-1]|uniref:DNA-directed RNA polymerase specialized sigma subunit sigma24-like protein n=1 Tax=Paramagnetospirillum magnetotacticum MS-1 TaxID=272627 RepID=A0A0C2YFC0_PARME|nr:RNA polymerase sigma factor [Paramagnetospirillum magnetotacticum]KIL98404.1 DNA-directed RNA polymerase specialized sigma subunit sigma24-like protein [Paramagnetospirillum magnetotacticum MS-1]